MYIAFIVAVLALLFVLVVCLGVLLGAKAFFETQQDKGDYEEENINL